MRELHHVAVDEDKWVNELVEMEAIRDLLKSTEKSGSFQLKR